MTLKIVDVSSHQENYNVGSYGEDGLIVKATQGTSYLNPYLDVVAQQAINKGLPWGIYHYAGGEDSTQEANYFLENVKKYINGINPPNLILDWEKGQNSAYGNGLWAENFIKVVKTNTNIQCGIYGNSDDMSQMTEYVVNNAWLWFAGYPTSKDVGWNPIAFPYSLGKFTVLTGWQFSSTPIDKSLFYLTVDEWKNLGQKNITSQMEDDELMKFTYRLDGKATVYYYNGEKITALSHGDQLKIIRQIYKDTTGRDLKQYEWSSKEPWDVRFKQANQIDGQKINIANK